MKVYIKSAITGVERNKRGITTITLKTGLMTSDQISMIGKEVSNYCELVLDVL